MAQFMLTIVSEMNEYNRVEDMKELCDRLFLEDGGKKPEARKELVLWVSEMLDMSGVPEGNFREYYLDEYAMNYDDRADELLAHIWSECSPEEQKRCQDCLADC
jgi:hypothetical protein